MFNCLHDELSNALTASDHEIGRRVVIDQANLQLAAIARVNEPRRIEAGDAMFERKPTSGLNETGIALW